MALRELQLIAGALFDQMHVYWTYRHAFRGY